MLFHLNSPLFSIITVCLNPGPDLDPTLESVLGQEFDDYELIIKDGGSKDGTQSRTWADPRVRFVSTPDKGIFDAMNQALMLAKGEFVCFLNAGDHFMDSRVLGDVGRVARANQDADFIYGDVRKPESRAGFEVYPERLRPFFVFTRRVCHQCWFLRRSTYTSYGGFERKSPGGGDYALLLKMIVRDHVKHHHLPRTITFYKGGGHSTTMDVIRQNASWHKALKKELFSPFEYYAYTIAWKVWLAAKPIIYDHCLSILWRPIQHYRSRRNQARLRSLVRRQESEVRSQ